MSITVTMALSAAIIMSGLSPQQFSDDLQCMFNCGEILLKTPSPSVLASRKSPRTVFSSTESLLKSLDHYLDIISNLEHKFQIFQELKKAPTPEKWESKHKHVKVIYQDRNILDLEEHLNSVWLFQHAVPQQGVTNRFENKSSGINGATIPRHVISTCQEIDCGFNEPNYY